MGIEIEQDEVARDPLHHAPVDATEKTGEVKIRMDVDLMLPAVFFVCLENKCFAVVAVSLCGRRRSIIENIAPMALTDLLNE